MHPKPTDGEGNGTPLQYSCLENPMDEIIILGVDVKESLEEKLIKLGDWLDKNGD